MLQESTELRDRLMTNTAHFRLALTEVLWPGDPGDSSPGCSAVCLVPLISLGETGVRHEQHLRALSSQVAEGPYMKQCFYLVTSSTAATSHSKRGLHALNMVVPVTKSAHQQPLCDLCIQLLPAHVLYHSHNLMRAGRLWLAVLGRRALS